MSSALSVPYLSFGDSQVVEVLAQRGSLAPDLIQNIGQERNRGLLQLQYPAATNSTQGLAGFYAHRSCFILPVRAGDPHSWGSLLEAQYLLPPLSQEQTRLFRRGSTLHCHNTLSVQ